LDLTTGFDVNIEGAFECDEFKKHSKFCEGT
jgi:hypothetical protein